MHFLYSRDSWSYQARSEPTLDFCLWVLQVDGLHVPPFDQHPDGDGSLRCLGLTVPDWQSWFSRVINPLQKERDVEQLRQQELAAYLKASGISDLEQLRQRYQAEQLKISTEPLLPPPPEWHFYHASWGGSSVIRNRLIELQKEYQQVSSQLDMLCRNLSGAQDREERSSGIRLYDELKSYAPFLPSFTIYFARYEYPLDYIVPPATLLMTVQEGQPEPQEFRERVLAVAAELAAQSGRRGKQRLYARIAGSTNQPTAEYRRHERKPIPLPPSAQELPRLTEPARQAVLDDLAEHSQFYGSPELITLRFLREKQRPGWKLYDVTFQESDGEQQRMIFILQQNEKGAWLVSGGGSSTDMQNRWSEIVSPVHDHPLIFLIVNWMSIDNHYYLLTAHGHVIDNGFSVAQVRLVNGAGQALEDTVEDGYVFFACKLDQQMQLPMQAELYNHQGKLVWRQTIPDTGLSLANGKR